MNGDLHVLALVKGEERYILLFDDSRAYKALATLGRWANDPELSFNIDDTIALTRRIVKTILPPGSEIVAIDERADRSGTASTDSASGDDIGREREVG